MAIAPTRFGARSDHGAVTFSRKLTPLCALASSSFGCDLSRIPVHSGPAGRAMCEALGAPAVTTREGIFLHPRLTPSDPRFTRIVLHEYAHAAQYRPARSRAPALSRTALELEAETAAMKALAGEHFAVPPRAHMPAAATWWPVILLVAAVGVGLTVYGSSQPRTNARTPTPAPASPSGRGQRTVDPASPSGLTPEEQSRIVKQHIEPHIHETWWGIIPFVGSTDQMLNGRNAYVQLGGAAFFVLDCTLIGGVAARLLSKSGTQVGSRAVLSAGDEVVATIVRPAEAAQAGLKQVVRGGGTHAQKEAFSELVGAVARNEIVLMSDDVVSRAVTEATRSGTYIFAGTRGMTNHSMVYLVHQGQVFVVHGGPLRYLYRAAPRAVDASRFASKSGNFVNGWNTVSVYGAEHMAGLSDEALQGLLGYWTRRGGALTSAAERIWAPGCSYTQANVLSGLTVFQSRMGDRLLPIFMSRAMQGGPGAHFVLNTGRQTLGTATHLGMIGTGYGVTRGGGTMVNVAGSWGEVSDQQVSVLPGNGLESGLAPNERIGFNIAAEGGLEPGAIVLEPVEQLDLGAAADGELVHLLTPGDLAPVTSGSSNIEVTRIPARSR